MNTDVLSHSLRAEAVRSGRNSSTPSLLARLSGLANGLLERARRRALEKRTVRVLRQLSDGTLKDIGIHRSEILSVAAGHRDRHRTRGSS